MASVVDQYEKKLYDITNAQNAQNSSNVPSSRDLVRKIARRNEFFLMCVFLLFIASYFPFANLQVIIFNTIDCIQLINLSIMSAAILIDQELKGLNDAFNRWTGFSIFIITVKIIDAVSMYFPLVMLPIKVAMYYNLLTEPDFHLRLNTAGIKVYELNKDNLTKLQSYIQNNFKYAADNYNFKTLYAKYNFANFGNKVIGYADAALAFVNGLILKFKKI